MRKAFYKNKLIAQIDDKNKEILKTVSRKLHFFRAYQAWAIDKDFLDKEKPNYKIVLEDKDTSKKYLAVVKDIKEYNFVKNFGFGEQYFYPESKWECVEPKSQEERDREEYKTYLG